MNRYTVLVDNTTRKAKITLDVDAPNTQAATVKAATEAASLLKWSNDDHCNAQVLKVTAIEQPDNVGKSSDEWQKDIYAALLCGIVATSLIGMGILTCLALLTMKHLGAYWE